MEARVGIRDLELALSLDVVGNVFAGVDHANHDDCIVGVSIDHPVHPRYDFPIVGGKADGLASDTRKLSDETERSPDIVDVSFGLDRPVCGLGVIGDSAQIAFRRTTQYNLTHPGSVQP